MRKNPYYELTDEAEIRRLIRENPWATLVSNPSTGLVASHYPILLEEDREELSIVTQQHVDDPRPLDPTPEVAADARRDSRGTVGLRLVPTRIVAKRKMSQNKSPEIVETVLGELEGNGPYANESLAREE